MRGQEVPGPTGGGTPPSFQPWLAAPSFTLPVFLPPPMMATGGRENVWGR